MTERWRPESLGELQSFIDNGLAQETHCAEFKERPPSNRDVAKHLAGLAIDGGDLVFGVAERRAGEFTIKPLEHAGVTERIDQIAQARVDRPLLVEVHLLMDDSDPTQGVLWVSVPSSPEAPHQVDGTYYKRAGKQTLPMSDAEVERLMLSRRTTLEGIESTLRAAMADDADGNLAHIFVVAQPIGAAPDELYDAIGGMQGWHAFETEVAGLLGTSVIGAWGSGRYTIGSQHHSDRARKGEGSYKELSFFNSGAVQWFSETGSFFDARSNHQRLLPDEVVDACLEAVKALYAIANKTRHRRSWDIGIGVTRVKGLKGYLDQRHSFFLDLDHVLPFRDDDYVRIRRVSYLHLQKNKWDIVRSLTHSFVEGCGFQFEIVAKRVGYGADAS